MKNIIDLEPIDVSSVEQETKHADAVLVSVNRLTVTTAIEYTSTAELLKAVKDKMKQLNESRLAITRPIDLAKKNIMALFDKPLEMLAKAENILKRQMLSYQDEQDRIARKEQERLNELARKEEEKQKAKLEKQAVKAETNGDFEKAEEKRAAAEAVIVPQAVVQKELPKVQGIKKVITWKFEVTDKTKIPAEYMMPNETMIGKVVMSTQGKIAIPGVKIYSQESISAGRR